MGYREKYFKENKGFMGKYRCVRCGKWFPKDQIDIDHIIPKSKGGSDALYNLQAMCRHCNRSKNNKTDKVVSDLIKHNTKRVIKNGVKSIFKGL
jgi:5-methylcytosine-specific restriction endonuclease McrA